MAGGAGGRCIERAKRQPLLTTTQPPLIVNRAEMVHCLLNSYDGVVVADHDDTIIGGGRGGNDISNLLALLLGFSVVVVARRPPLAGFYS